MLFHCIILFNSMLFMEYHGNFRVPQRNRVSLTPSFNRGVLRVIYDAFEPVDHYWVEDEDDLLQFFGKPPWIIIVIYNRYYIIG